MRRGGRILVLLGIILGLVTAAGTFLALSNQPQPTAQVTTQPVVIALQNIPDRSVITPQVVTIQQWPAPVPAGAIGRVEDVIGNLATEPIYQGQLILPQMFISTTLVPGSHSNASYIVPTGKVAVAFPISPLSSVANALQVGDSVDIMLTLNPAALAPQGASQRTTTTTATTGTEGQPVTQLMLQNVLILQVGSWNNVAPSGGQQQAQPAGDILTFALTPQDALALKSAREQGTIELELRHAGDTQTFTTEPVTLQYLNKRFNFNLLPAK